MTKDTHSDVCVVHIGTNVEAVKDNGAVSFTNVVIWYKYY
jgi:hypothetical protein